jgi:5-methylcytosine-specific restriction endonuclease McrA
VSKMSTLKPRLIQCCHCFGLFECPTRWNWGLGKHPFVCGEQCRKERRRIVLKKYKKSKKGIECEKRWRTNPKKKVIDKKARSSPLAKHKAVLRSWTRKQRNYHAWVADQNRLFRLRWRFTKSKILKFQPWRDWWSGHFKMGCSNCGKKSNETKLVLDHIIPRFHGGEDVFENFQILCQSCNGSKGYGKERTSSIWKK